ncbi:MAG: MBL fold metallo-hydrolase [Magnetococcales bacterium]|nr:MBL fold metallo-hydrolase [Magnetococcales bacterium]
MPAAADSPLRPRAHLGTCRSVAITCISEIGWHDTDLLLADIKAGGGANASQWDKAWHSDNAAGSSSLIDLELLDGTRRKFLLDCGWNEPYMRQRFEESGVAAMLARGEIEFLFLSHEHLDHLWGLQAILRYCPDIAIRVPATFSDRALAFIRGELAAPTHPVAESLIRHTGVVSKTPPGVLVSLYPGCVAVAFDLPVLLGIVGEQSLYFRVRDKGVVCVTGCCHQGVNALADHALDHVADESTLYGLYGGLHIAPFGPLTAEQERLVADLRRYGFRKIVANHCTGESAVRRMVELGYPVVAGSGREGSRAALMPGDGERVVFD